MQMDKRKFRSSQNISDVLKHKIKGKKQKQ